MPQGKVAYFLSSYLAYVHVSLWMLVEKKRNDIGQLQNFGKALDINKVYNIPKVHFFIFAVGYW